MIEKLNNNPTKKEIVEKINEVINIINGQSILVFPDDKEE